jgi:hypothetical protein
MSNFDKLGISNREQTFLLINERFHPQGKKCHTRKSGPRSSFHQPQKIKQSGRPGRRRIANFAQT